MYIYTYAHCMLYDMCMYMYICIYSECMSIYVSYTLCNEHISGYYWEKKGLSCCCVLYITLYYIILYYIILA